MSDISVKGKLVDANRLLEQLFEEKSRPSLRWLRQQTKAKAIPFYRIGHLIFFDADIVREVLASKNMVGGRHLMASRPGV